MSHYITERCCCLMCVYLEIIISTVFCFTGSSFSQHSISTYVTAAAGQYSVKLGKLQASRDQVLKLKDHLSAQFSREIRQLFMKEHSLVITFLSICLETQSKQRFLCKQIARSPIESVFIYSKELESKN